MSAEVEYEVSVSCIFNATSPEDAVGQMASWLSECAYEAGYRVERIPIDDESQLVSVFIDAEKIDWEQRFNEEAD